MAQLRNIVKGLESHFLIEVRGNVPDDCLLEGIRFLSSLDKEKKQLDLGCLYIGQYEDYKELRAPGHVLLLNCSENTSCLDYLYIMQNLPIQDIFNVIQDEMIRYHQIQLKKEALFQALHRNQGLDELVKIAHSYIDNPISVCDNSFSIIGCYPPLDDDRNLELRNGKFYLKSTFFKNMIDSKVTDRIYHSPKPFIAMIEDFPFDWVFAGIRINHAIVGYICIRGMIRSFTDNDLDFIHIFSKVLSIAMQKNNAYQNPTGLKYEYFLGDLLSGQFDNYDFIEQRMTQLGHSIHPYYHILILRFTDPAGKHPTPKYYYDQILTMFPKCMVVLFQRALTILLPSQSKTLASETQLNRFQSFLQMNEILAAVSFPFRNILQVPKYYQQTLALFELPQSSLITSETECPNIIDYRSHYLEHVFSLTSNKELLLATIHPDITTILDYDAKNHTEYIHTLQTYLYNNRNAVATAKELHIHKSTFFYRLSKMADLFGFDMNDGTLLFAYDYSFRLIHFLEMYEK